jgi:hypothetical protein
MTTEISEFQLGFLLLTECRYDEDQLVTFVRMIQNPAFSGCLPEE